MSGATLYVSRIQNILNLQCLLKAGLPLGGRNLALFTYFNKLRWKEELVAGPRQPLFRVTTPCKKPGPKAVTPASQLQKF